MMKLFRFIGDIFNVFYKARRIREDEERREKSVVFAISAIVYSIFLCVAVCLGAFLFGLDETGILYIFVLIIAVGLMIGGLLSFIGALLRVIAQFSLNRGVMSWIALIVFIASITASIVVTLQILG